MPDSKRVPNHLVKETSPYLLQHIYNPVDWYPWGEEALNRAKEENKLIFLSIGYSTCHWCHVMAHESFEDETVASILNDNYICIKVDREERPDLDSIYMNACQMMTGSGGWPLNLWLTPDQKPIYAGTYFAPHNQMGRPGFISVLTHLKKMWKNDHEELLGKSDEIMAFISKQGQSKNEEVDQFVAIQAVRDLKSKFDPEYGGFSSAPKFPSPHQLLFLMNYYQQHPEEHLLELITKTLDGMYLGGIYDHVGGGFARYSVDEKWLVPHFEKMLYDNALLLKAYNLGYLITQNPVYKAVAYGIVAFVKRELRSEEGGFYTALDADSEGVEGKFYVFERAEVETILGSEAEAYCRTYDITEKGNFEGKNIPNRIGNEVSIEVIEAFKESHQKLLDYRSKRIRPSLDHKILVSMNGLMMSSLSHMSRVYDDAEILSLAEETYQYIRKTLVKEATLYGSMTDGRVKEYAFLDDYAFYTEGLIELYEATMEEQYLMDAISLTDTLDQGYWDKVSGGYYMTNERDEALIQRPIEAYDGAIPSGNSVMAYNLLRLSAIVEEDYYLSNYDRLIQRFGFYIKKQPSAFCYLLLSLMYRIDGYKSVKIEVDDLEQLRNTAEWIKTKWKGYFAYRIILRKSSEAAFGTGVTGIECDNYACKKIDIIGL